PNVLEGDNAYTVEGRGKHRAVRSTHFVHLPPVLHIQLMRWQYDPDYDRVVKVHDYFEFPEELDMNKYMISLNEQQEAKLKADRLQWRKVERARARQKRANSSRSQSPSSAAQVAQQNQNQQQQQQQSSTSTPQNPSLTQQQQQQQQQQKDEQDPDSESEEDKNEPLLSSEMMDKFGWCLGKDRISLTKDGHGENKNKD
ncbi:MAG: hypothetical protein EZS28_050294, partial [Streblomastix strix]